MQPFSAIASTRGLRLIGLLALVAIAPVAVLSALLRQGDLWNATLEQWLLIAAGSGVAGAVLVGAVVAALERRRIADLMEATNKVAAQDFTAALPARGSDEWSELERAFNAMTVSLGRTLSVQGLLTEMDEAILNKLDVATLIRNALLCLRRVTQGEAVIVGLFENDSTDAMRAFVIRKGERNRIDSRKLSLDAEQKRRIPLTPLARTEPQAPFPDEFVQWLRESAAVEHFYIAPMARGGRAWGVMVCGHVEPQEYNAEQTRLLTAVSSRLIAGFSSAEREQKLHSLAYVDALTGLPNRTAIQSLLGQKLTEAESAKTLVGVMVLDLDRFKQINDTHGHGFGDRLLVPAANRIRNNIREDDLVARIGGDEFVIVLADIKTPREAASAARKLIQALSRRFEIDGHTIYTGASVGIAVYPDSGLQSADLLKAADTSMYRAKSEGRSRYAFYQEPMNLESQRRSQLDGELRNALLRKELVLHYQPQIDLKTGMLSGVEALVRWQHPTRGLLYPKDFIEYAEEIGLIPEIGQWVMQQACEHFMRWSAEGVRVPRVSVNVSNGQLPRSNFLPAVRQVLESTGIPASCLEMEVTESMLVQGGKAAIEALNQLNDLGVLIAIDDFGTGYSSFSYLKTMPARVLKLDMSFLVDARMDNDAGKIVAAIINMAHALQKEVVSEGVEHVEQLKLLKALGCERGQGYLFGRAVSAEQIARTFRRIPDFAGSAGNVDPADPIPLLGAADRVMVATPAALPGGTPPKPVVLAQEAAPAPGGPVTMPNTVPLPLTLPHTFDPESGQHMVDPWTAQAQAAAADQRGQVALRNMPPATVELLRMEGDRQLPSTLQPDGKTSAQP